MNGALPEIIFYSETGGKAAPFYRKLGGIRSAFKTTWWGQNGWNRPSGRPKVYRGTVTWEEIDLETGLTLLPNYSDLDIGRHLAVWHVNLVAGPDQQATHDLAHQHDLDHVHRGVR